MARIDEHEIFAHYIGERVNDSKLQALARYNGTGYGAYADSKEYIIAHVDYYDQEEFQKIFKLTPTLTERWDYRGIDFRVYLYIRGGIITGGHLFKYIETSESSHFRPNGYETDTTQQELRIVGRILQYLITEV